MTSLAAAARLAREETLSKYAERPKATKGLEKDALHSSFSLRFSSFSLLPRSPFLEVTPTD